MTTGELIALLREADPDGTIPVCVGNADVYFVDRVPAYYDGRLQQLVHDPAKKPYWTIVGARLTGRGEKVRLRVMDILDVFLDEPDLPVETDNEQGRETVEAWREEARKICAEADAMVAAASKEVP